MTQTVVILGANGRFGRAAVEAFKARGWDVRRVTRKGENGAVACDAMDGAAVIRACAGADVIVHALNPLYTDWVRVLPVHTANVIAAARACGARVMIPGNVYPFGTEDGPWCEDTVQTPQSRKGALRVTMEQRFAASGVPTIVLRGGDFIEGVDTGNWFESYITKDVHKGRITYPGRLDAVHAWAYLPDMARAMVALAEIETTLSPFEVLHYEGLSLTGAQLIDAIAARCGAPLRVKRFPWWLIRAIAPFSPLMREVVEMRYLWDHPHRLDGTRLRALIPDHRDTPLAEVMAQVLPAPQPGDAAPQAA
ncbi:NAD-dependent epimerase/dehydratase family protein [Sulfitobacter albidus]|uniref:NAD-dependent epimerase/dehydratase family protein n=1 Tax=Sulfitobacter albidus TaxID=2829501 RepID=A0A975PMN8_9RHOB|nr:NAD-dependent epimerase/dehydratase family protein [Sulfitobacter albidus]QUJ76997.1 NAD-dependent epimerase/dehydratase family protein [Sulfitobacter albidus]